MIVPAATTAKERVERGPAFVACWPGQSPNGEQQQRTYELGMKEFREQTAVAAC